MKEPELEEEALRASARGHELTIERQSLKGETPPVTVIGPTGATSKAQLKSAEPGLSRATIDVDQARPLSHQRRRARQALVNVGPDNPLEFREVVSTTEKLRPLAEATGGTVRRIAAGDGDEIVSMPRLIAMHESPSYGGADYLAIKRTGVERRRRRLASVARGRFPRPCRAARSAGLVWGREGGRGGKWGLDEDLRQFVSRDAPSCLASSRATKKRPRTAAHSTLPNRFLAAADLGLDECAISSRQRGVAIESAQALISVVSYPNGSSGSPRRTTALRSTGWAPTMRSIPSARC